jgi:3-hydroxy-3-methylglutaryl CoA synthase
MPGIVSYGAYIPPTRLGFSVLAGRAPKEGGPERAVAWNDEDAVTMAVAAGANALRGLDRAGVDALFFASTTYPFKEKQGAALIAKALDLGRNARTTDVSGSLRAGTDALQAAFDAVAAGSVRQALVIASDCRLGAPGSAQERAFGDGAAAFLIGSTDTCTPGKSAS